MTFYLNVMELFGSNVTNSVTKGETLANQTTESMNEIDKPGLCNRKISI